MNTTQRIRDEDDLMDLKKEFRNSSLPELLLESHDLNRKEGLKFLRYFHSKINLNHCSSMINWQFLAENGKFVPFIWAISSKTGVFRRFRGQLWVVSVFKK